MSWTPNTDWETLGFSFGFDSQFFTIYRILLAQCASLLAQWHNYAGIERTKSFRRKFYVIFTPLHARFREKKLSRLLQFMLSCSRKIELKRFRKWKTLRTEADEKLTVVLLQFIMTMDCYRLLRPAAWMIVLFLTSLHISPFFFRSCQVLSNFSC